MQPGINYRFSESARSSARLRAPFRIHGNDARMPRRRIPIVPGIPYHVTQRAAHREFILAGDDAKRLLASLLADWAIREGVIVDAFVIMDNHFHLSASTLDEGALERMIGNATQALSRWLNTQRGANGPNWEKRFFASVMDERHALAAAAYIERNPVAAGLVRDAWDWPWSSAAFHVGGCARPRLLTGGDGPPGGMSQVEWARTLRGASVEEVGAALHRASHSSSVLADKSWVERLEATLGRRISPRPRGRPRQRAAA